MVFAVLSCSSVREWKEIAKKQSETIFLNQIAHMGYHARLGG